MAKSRKTPVSPSDEGRTRLERIRTSLPSLVEHVRNAEFILNLGDGCGLIETIRGTGKSNSTVRRWRRRPCLSAARTRSRIVVLNLV